MQLGGKRVLLTGASGGIGEAIARALDARGANVLLSGRRRDALEEIAAGMGDSAEVLVCDLADREAAASLLREAGEVDVLVANAALPASGRLDGFSPEQIDRALDVNLRAPIQLARELVPALVKRGSGHLVFISSLSGKIASPGSALYSATKFGLRGFSLGLREDLHDTPVGVTLVSPGFVRDAGMFAEAKVELPRGTGSVTPAEVAEGVIKGIEQDRAEVDVAPLSLKASVRFAGLAPGLAYAVQRRLGASELTARIAEGQADKR